MRVFSLEYISQIIHADELHLVSAKKSQFKIKAQIGPFISKDRSTEDKVNKMIKEMGFNHSLTRSYDPAGIISKKRVENRSTPYVHTHRPAIEQYSNQVEWVTNTL